MQQIGTTLTQQVDVTSLWCHKWSQVSQSLFRVATGQGKYQYFPWKIAWPVATLVRQTKMWYILFVPLLLLNHRHWVTLLWIPCDCYFVASDQVTMRWSHLAILMWPSVGDNIVMSPSLLHCDGSPSLRFIICFTVKSPSEFQMSIIWRLHDSWSQFIVTVTVASW